MMQGLSRILYHKRHSFLPDDELHASVLVLVFCPKALNVTPKVATSEGLQRTALDLCRAEYHVRMGRGRDVTGGRVVGILT